MNKIYRALAAILWVLFPATAAVLAQAPVVVTVYPAQNALSVPASANIEVTFDRAMDPGSFYYYTFVVESSISGLRSGAYGYQLANNRATFNPISDFLPGEVITVTLTQGIESANHIPMVNSYSWSFTAKAHLGDKFLLDSTYGVVGHPRSVVCADFNDDGILDLAAVDSSDNSVLILTGSSNGSFALGDAYSVNTRPFELFAASLDDNGGMDLVVAGSASDSVCVLLNEGNQFSPAVKYFCGTIPSSVTVADLEGDGYPDIAVSDYSNSEVWTLTNRGDGTYEAAVYYSLNLSGYGPCAIAAGDVDGDGLIDVVTANDLSSNLSILRNNGAGGFSAYSSPGVGSHPRAICLADFDGDGDLDIAAAAVGSHSVSVLLNQGNNVFSLTSSITVGGSPNNLKAADFDGDADLDLVASNGSDGICAVLVNNSPAGFSLNWLYRCNGNPQSVCTGDFDGDGMLDFAIAKTDADSLSVYLNRIFPKVESTLPAQHALNADPASSVSAKFSVAMNQGSFDAASLVVSGSASGFHAGEVAYSIPDTMVTLADLTSPFHAGEVATAFLKAGVQSSSGIAADSAFAWSFTVDSDPADTLQSRSTQLVGEGPWEVVVADFDLDGLIDVATCNRYSNNVSVCFNGWNKEHADTLAFDLILTSDVGGFPVSIVAADFNEDGFLDLATANLSSDDISVLLNNGDRTFVNQNVFPLVSGFAPTSLTAAELNGDGHIDLAVAENASNVVSIMINNGGGEFTRIADVPVGDGPESVRGGDLDNDGDLDLAVANGGSNNVTLLWNSGTSFYSQSAALGSGSVKPVSVCLADIDRNGWLDIIAADKNSDDVAILLNAGAAAFSLIGPFPVGDEPQSVAASDMNGDGLLDIMVANETPGNSLSGTIMVLFNEGDSSFVTPVEYLVGPRPYSVTVADFDNDGDMDLASAEVGWTAPPDSISILLNRSFTYVAASKPTMNELSIDVASNITVEFNHEMDSSTISDSTILVTGSFTGPRKYTTWFNEAHDSVTFDPLSDFLAGEAVSVVVTDGVVSSEGYPLDHVSSWTFTTSVADFGGGFEKQSPDLTCGSHPWSVRLSDLDADTDLDAVVANESSNNVRVFFNQGSGTFGIGTDYSVDMRPRAVVAADLNADGYVDLATANFDGNSISVLLNDQHGLFASQPASPFPLNAGTLAHPTSLVAADLDNDGDVDLVTANEGANSVTVLSNDGEGDFSTKSSYFVGSMPRSVEAGDFDNDGDIDLVTANAVSDSVTVLWNNGLNFSGNRDDYLVRANGFPRAVVATDLDGDGDLDLAVANEHTNNVSVLLNDLGNNTFATSGNFNVGYYPASIDAGDVNGDHRVDLATVDFNDGTVSVLLNSGPASFLPRYSETLSSGWPSSVCMGDLDKNLTLDLVTTISDAGTMAVFLNVGQAGDICCVGRVGNANGLGTYPNEVTISDIQLLVTAKFISSLPCEQNFHCLAEADVNQSGGVRPTCNDVTISDIQTLVNHLFIAGPANAPLKECL